MSADALGFAERAGLVSVRGARVELHHPLVRSAILQGMSAGARRSAHRALADALDDDLRLDERAWHLAAAAGGSDAHAAEELERAGARARRRSAHASAAAALERAAELSVDVPSQARRLVAAAAAAWHAGEPDRASLLLDRADPLVAERRLRADVEHLKGEIALRCGVLLDACDILIAGAEDIAPLDTRKALQMLLQAREAAGWAGDTPRTIETGHRAAALPTSEDPASRFLADLLVGVGSLYEGKTAIGLPLVRDVVAHVDDFDVPGWVVWAATGAQALGDEARASVLLQRAIALARASGAVDELTYVLLAYVLMGLLAGRFGVAAEAAEGLTLAREAGLPNAASTHLAMLAWFAGQRGDEGECRGSAATAIELAQPSGGAFANAIAEWGVGLLELSRRRAGEAVARLLSVGSEPARRGTSLLRADVGSRPGRSMRARRTRGRRQSRRGGVRRLCAAWRAHLGDGARRTVPRAALGRRNSGLRGGAAAARARGSPVRPRSNRAALRRVPGPAGPARRVAGAASSRAGDIRAAWRDRLG